MKGQAPDQPATGPSFIRAGIWWSIVMAAMHFAFVGLYRQQVLSEEQAILLILIALPVVAFALSGRRPRLARSDLERAGVGKPAITE